MALWCFPHALWACNTQHKLWKYLFNTSLLPQWVCSCKKNQEWAALPSSHLAKSTLPGNTDVASLDFLVTIIYLSITQLAFAIFKKSNTHLFQLYKRKKKKRPTDQSNIDLNIHTQKIMFSLWISCMMIDSVSMSMGNSLQTAFKYANVGSTVPCNPQNCWVSKLFMWGIWYTIYKIVEQGSNYVKRSHLILAFSTS